MIEYLNILPEEEQAQLTDVIRLLLRQTFIPERKYDKRTGRFLFNKEFRICNKHLEFLREYFKIAGIELQENSQAGVIYVRGQDSMAEKLSKLSTIYLLVLKLIYDEQMSQASTSIYVFTTLGELNERVGSFGLLKERPSFTEIRRTLTLLKRYQIIELLETMEELESDSRLVIYPCINMVLFGEDIRSLLHSFAEEEQEPQNESFIKKETEDTDGNEDE